MSFDKLCSLNVNDKVEQKQKLSYLSWTYAWETFKKTYPESSYEVFRDSEGRPYLFDKDLGYMVFVKVNNGSEVHEMWLPVMDSNNNAMKNERYSYQVKEYKNRQWTGSYIDKYVEPATMFDINKAIMRCFVKCLAMFGLGLYIYSGEDLPPESEEQKQKKEDEKAEAEAKKRLAVQNSIMSILEKKGLNSGEAFEFCNLSAQKSKGEQNFQQRPGKWLLSVQSKIEKMSAEEIKTKLEDLKK